MKKLLIPPVFLLISLVVIVLFYFLLPSFNLIPFPFNLIGLIVAFIGFSIMGQSRMLFKKHNTPIGFEKSTFFITEGIFANTRNPMYLGMFLLLLGIAICFMNLLSMAVPFLFILLMRTAFIPMEERMMQEAFGQEYLMYKETVGRWF